MKFLSIKNPAIAALLVWGVTAFLYNLRVLDYYDMDSKTLTILWSCSGMYVVGSWLGNAQGHFFGNRGPISRNDNLVHSCTYFRCFLVCLLLSAVGSLVTIGYNFARYGGLSGILGAAGQIKGAGGFSTITNLLSGLSIATCFLGATCLFMNRNLPSRRKKLCYGAVIVALLQSMATLGRLALVISFLGVAVISLRFYTFQGNRKGYMRLIALAILVATLFVYNMEIRLKSGETDSVSAFLNQDYRAIFQKLQGNERIGLGTALLYTYHYMAGPLAAFNEYTHSSKRFNGLFLAPYIARALGESTNVIYTSTLVLTPVPMNVGTALREAYLDFGIPGCLLLAFFLPFVTSFLYGYYNRSKNMAVLPVFALVSAACLLSVFIYIFMATSIFLNLIVLSGIMFYTMRRSRLTAHKRRAAFLKLSARHSPSSPSTCASAAKQPQYLGE